MVERTNLGAESSAVQKHLEIMQGVIMRMGENSRSCKVWSVTLVAAILVLVARTGDADHVLIAVAPAVLFYVLDAYYLALERGFRRSYHTFVRQLHEGRANPYHLFTIDFVGRIPRETLWAMFMSFSVFPFYLMVVATIILAWWLIF